jgi:hypothetical protein
MSLAARGAVVVVAVAATLALAACGGSVADADSSRARAAQPSASAAPAATPFCTASQASSDAIGPLNTLVSRGKVDPAELARAVDAVRRTETDLLNTAPPEVHADVQETVDAVDAQLDSLVAHGGDGAAVSADPALNAKLNGPELAAANQRLTAYLTRTCTASGSGQQ